MKEIKIILVLIIGSCFLCCCESATYEEISPEVVNVTYLESIKPIIDNNCLSCHSPAAAQFPPLQTYEQVRESAENGNLICRIDDQSCGSVMPQSGRMPQITINTIKEWALNGYPN